MRKTNQQCLVSYAFARQCCLLVAIAALTAIGVFSQSFTGTILGVVTDSSGAIVPGVTVVTINQGTGERRSVKSTEAGQYTVSALPPGDYSLEAELSGFKRYVRKNLKVEVTQSIRADVVLEPGDMTQTLDVSGESPLLETANAAVGQMVDSAKIGDLPLVGRNTVALVALTPGIVPANISAFAKQPVLSNPYDHGAFSANSGVQMGSEFLLDGIPNNAWLWDSPALVPSAEAVQEFKVQTSSLSAEFGHTGGAIINLTTKSGTNTFHGSLFEFLRNDALEANTFFNNRNNQPRPKLKMSNFGGTLGGPVKKNQTFFFFSYDGFRDRMPAPVLTTVPLAPMRQGDFSQVVNAAGQPVIIYDPGTVASTPGVGSGYTRLPFAGNRIPVNRFDPMSAKVKDYWELPNLPGVGPTQSSNFTANPVQADVQDQVNVKIDHIFGEKHRIFGRFTSHRQLPGPVDYFKTVKGANSRFVINIWTKQLALNHTWTHSPTLMFDFRYGLSRQFWINDPASLGTDLKALGLPDYFTSVVQQNIMPSFEIPGYSSVGEAGFNSYIHRGDNMHTAQISGTKALAKHWLKFGFEFRGFLFNDIRAPDCCGAFSFSVAFTQADPLRASGTAGHPFASFLLGYPAAGRMQFFPLVSLNQNYYGLHLQDDYRITSNLTLNLGLRWDLETPKTERYNRLSYFDPYVRSPLSDMIKSDVRGGLRFPGVDGLDRYQWGRDWNNIAPRLGFAYRITPGFVARGGGGIIYHQTLGQGGAIGHGNDGYGASNQMITTLDGGITPKNRISDPFPEGLGLPEGSSRGLLARIGEALRPWTGDFSNPYSVRWSFGLQREFSKAFLVDVAYIGAHSVGLPITVPQNQLRPEYLPLQTQLSSQVDNPFYQLGIIKTGTLSQPRITRAQLLRPYPQFVDIPFYVPIAQGNYHSMQMKLERRFRGNMGFLMAYTISKSLTDAGNTGIFGFQSPVIQNYYNLAGEKAISPIDVSQRMVISYEWELPFGKGKLLLGNAHPVLDKLVSGWQMNGIATFQTGIPLAVTSSVNQIGLFTPAARPNIAAAADPNLSGSDRSFLRWFNTSVFSQPPAFEFGNVSRTLANSRAPGVNNFDLSLFKNTRITESLKLQLRFEAFNAFNHTNFLSPNTSFGTGNFGIITSTLPARVVQVGARIVF